MSREVNAVAADEKKKTKKKSSRGRRRGQMPTKRVINLATQGEKPLNLLIAIPAILLILAAAVAFSKFLVIDRMAEVSAAQSVVSQLQKRLDDGYEELADLDDLTTLYAHYTYSGFTSEELNRTDRVEALQLIRDMLIPYAEISNWTLNGNNLTVNLSAGTLQDVNLIVQQLERQDLVNFCTVNTANASDTTRDNSPDNVKARVSIYLNTGTGVKKG